MNDLTKCLLLAGSAAFTTSAPVMADFGYRNFPRDTVKLGASASDYIRAVSPDGRSYSYFSEVDDTFFELPIVANVRIKLKKGFSPFEFFVED
jgi:hypothetical protein